MEGPKMNPYAAVVIGVISVSASAIFVKLCSAPSGVIAFYRLFFSVLFIIPIFLKKHISELRYMTKKDLLFSIIAGILLAFHFILWFESLNYTSVASSTVLVTLQPLFAFLGTYLFFKEKLSGKAFFCGIITIAGSVLISWGDCKISESALFGDFLSLIACALITGYLLVGQSIRKRMTLISYTFVVYLISSIALFIFILTVKEPLYPYKLSDWFYFILLAIVPTLLGHSLFNWALRWVSTSIISMAILFEPVGATILAFIILGEKTVWPQIAGGLIVILGISLFVLDSRKARLDHLN